MASNIHKRMRRSATGVLGGYFDPRPPRDVLTSLLNGVGPYKEVERDEEARAKRKQEKKELKREEKKRIKAAARARQRELNVTGQHATMDGNFASTSSLPQPPPVVNSGVSGFWRAVARPTIHIPAQPSVSVTPSPLSSPRRMASTPGTTPGPSISSSTSRKSSKRPHTPDADDDEQYMSESMRPTTSAPLRKKRAAAKKGWKGWVEGSPPPSEKLINLDSAPILQDRRLRSGKNFDGIGIGTHGWV